MNQYAIKNAFITHLQYEVQRIKVDQQNLPIIDCVVFQTPPILQVCDESNFIGCDFSNSAKKSLGNAHSLDKLKNKHIRIKKYNFIRRAKKNYILFVDELTVGEECLPGKIEDKLAVLKDDIVKALIEKHQQLIEKNSLFNAVDDLPSMDMILSCQSSKSAMIVSKELNDTIEHAYSKEIIGGMHFLDISAEEQNVKLEGILHPIKVPSPIKNPMMFIEVQAKSFADTPFLNPSLGTMEPEIKQSLNYLISECKPREKKISKVPESQPEGSMVIQPEEKNEVQMESPEIEKQQVDEEEKVKDTDIQKANIGIGEEMTPKLEKLRKQREKEKQELHSLEKNTDLLDIIKDEEMTNIILKLGDKNKGEEKKDLLASGVTIKLDNMERYKKWRKMKEDSKKINRITELDLFDLTAEEYIEFSVRDMQQGNKKKKFTNV